MSFQREKTACMIVCLLMLASLLSGCLQSEPMGEGNRSAPDNTTRADPGFNVLSYPRVDGSTSTHPLAVLIACKLLNVPYSWGVSGEYFMFGTYERDLYPEHVPGKGYICEYINEYVVHHGTHASYVNLIDRKADLILVARQPSRDELELARERGVELAAKPVALDAFVFLLNKNNPVSSLTADEVRGIYAGRITGWEQVGGSQSRIQAYQREENSGSQELMESLVMRDQAMISAPEMILYGMMGPINRLSHDENGIGYSVYYFKEQMSYGSNVTSCAIDGVYPDRANISSKTYPLTSEVYAVVRKDLSSRSSAYELWDWLSGEGGQSAISESGYVPIAQ